MMCLRSWGYCYCHVIIEDALFSGMCAILSRTGLGNELFTITVT